MCLNPIRVKTSETPVPCGKCPKCRARRAQGWAIRIMAQFKDKSTKEAHFVTLTYDDQRLPRNDQGFPTLNKSDVKNFIKRLRKISKKSGRQIKYYAVGEYGSKTERPHYHIIIFNAKTELIEKAWSYEESARAKANRANSLRRRNRSKRSVYSGLHVQASKN